MPIIRMGAPGSTAQPLCVQRILRTCPHRCAVLHITRRAHTNQKLINPKTPTTDTLEPNRSIGSFLAAGALAAATVAAKSSLPFSSDFVWGAGTSRGCLLCCVMLS